MIHVTEIIKYLREKLPSWRIDGAAELAAAGDKSNIEIPAMFVMLGTFKATTLSSSTFLQEYDERFFVLIGVPNTQDRTGKYAQDAVLNARRSLFTTLVNYKIDDDSHTIQYVGDQMAEMDKARYWHQFEFKISGRIDPDDVTPLELDYFDKMQANWNLAESDDGTYPNAQDVIEPLYFERDPQD